MQGMELYFVTSNEQKAREVEHILGFPIKTTTLELQEIQSLDLEEIVRQKVTAAYDAVSHPVIVDDVGFYVTSWNGFPGPFIKFLLGSGGNELLLRMMESEENREVIVRSAIGYHDGTAIHSFIGEARGEIVREPRGQSWGWEPIFQPEGYTLTYAEIDREEKNSISMRRRALEKFRQYLKSHTP